MAAHHPIDTTDAAILQVLQEDSRRSFSDIGRLVGLTRQAVRRRVQIMINRHVFTYTICIDYQKITPKKVAYLTVTMKKNNHRDFLDFCHNQKEVRECHRVPAGNVCYLLKVKANNDETLNNFKTNLERLYAKYSGLLYRVKNDVAVTHLVDKTDKDILKMLHENSHLTMHNIGELVGLTHTAVGTRVQNMIDQGIILRHTIRIDPQHITSKKVVYVAVLEPITCDQDFFDFIKRRRKEIREYHSVIGESTYYLLRVEVTDDSALNNFTNELCIFANPRLYSVMESPIIKEDEF